MACSLSWGYVITSWVATATIILFTIMILVNFLRRRTTGTAMLLQTFVFFMLSKIALSISMTIQITPSPNLEIAYIISVFASMFPLFGIVLLYNFSCRHILRDSIPIQTFISITFSAIIGIILGLQIYEIVLIPIEESSIINLNSLTSDIQIISGTLFISMIQIIIQTFIFLRIAIRSFVLSRKTEQLLRKRGFQLIGWGLIIYYATGFIAGIIYGFGIEHEGIQFGLWVLRNLGIQVAYFIMYLGWILPNWLRKRLTKKTWIEKTLKDFNL